MKKILTTLALLWLTIGCTPNKPATQTKEPNPSHNAIKLPSNIISVKECTLRGGKVWNSLGETSYNGELIGTVKGFDCPCACLLPAPKSNTLYVTINGKKEVFKGDAKSIKTFDECKKAGFKIIKNRKETCMMGEPHMTNGNYRTFTNRPMEQGKTCADYTYSSCPSSCVPKCTSSSCAKTPYGMACTSDCDGVGSCLER